MSPQAASVIPNTVFQIFTALKAYRVLPSQMRTVYENLRQDAVATLSSTEVKGMY